MSRKVWLILILAGMMASCTKTQPPAKKSEDPELATKSITLWSARTELFMEHPEMVRGERCSYAVHLTDLTTYRPLAEGLVTLEFSKSGRTIPFEGKQPSRPGIFRVDVQLDEPGRYKVELKLRTRGFDDGHEIGDILVYENRTAALAQAEPQTQGEAIRFLKEQQWSSGFAAELAAPRTVEESLQVPAVVRVRGGGEGSVISPIKGQLSTRSELPIPGQRVRKGQVIASVVSFTANPQDPAGLKLELRQAETDLMQARRLRERLEGLLSERAIPARRVEEAKVDELRAQARIQTAQERLAIFERSRSGSGEDASGSFDVRAPLSGMVTALSVVAGSSVEAGQELLRIMDPDRVWVEAQVPESESEILKNIRKAELQIGSVNVVIPGIRGRIEKIGNIVDAESRRIPVIFEVSNNDGLFRIGQSLLARLGKGKSEDRISVPVSALVDDGGMPVVFVQRDGESFERRPVRTGSSSGEYVQIIEGIHAGDRVVSRGAYLIRLAALSTQIPAHGHVH